jgi:Domain of unknown function (DUF397)
MTTQFGLVWRRSSFSGSGGTGGGDCVEAALLPDHFALRDSKNPPVTLEFPRASLHALLRHATG